MHDSKLLDWVLEEESDNPDMLPIESFMQIKKKNEIHTQLCPTCKKQSDGYACTDKECPFEAPLFI